MMRFETGMMRFGIEMMQFEIGILRWEIGIVRRVGAIVLLIIRKTYEVILWRAIAEGAPEIGFL
jgi:hypothetical protein